MIMFKTLKNVAIAATVALTLSACGSKVEVPPAHVGKVVGSLGYKEGTIPTSKFRLDACIAYCDKLVLLSVADTSVNEKLELFMPQDRLTMTFDLRMTMSVKPTHYDELFTKVPPVEAPDGDRIPIERAYQIYAQQIIRSEAREYLSQYSIGEIVSNREQINAGLSEKIRDSVSKRTPFFLTYAGLADIKYPDIIVKAQENAAERREAIQQEEAQLEISKVQLERQLQEQQLQRKVDVEKAQAEAEVARIQSNSLTPQYMRYRELQIMERLADSDNKVFVPSTMLDSMAGQVQIGRQ